MIGTWYAVEVSYQNRAVEKNQQQLNTLKDRKEAILKAAAAADTCTRARGHAGTPRRASRASAPARVRTAR